MNESIKKYGVILADPPWSFRNGGNGAAKNHYSTMSDNDIYDLPVQTIAADNSVLLLWATWAKLDVAMNVINAWGFRYKSGFPWIKATSITQQMGKIIEFKPTWGLGYWIRGCSEPILIGTRGKAQHPNTNWAGLISAIAKHSRKPEHIHQYAESLLGPRIELFARERREGWDAWGNEVESDIWQ